MDMDFMVDIDNYIDQPSDGIEGKLLLTNFASHDADIYCEAIRRFNKSNGSELTEVFQIKSKAYDFRNKLLPNVNALFVAIGTSSRIISKFWKIYDKVKNEYRNTEELKSTSEEINEYLEGIWDNGNKN